MYLKISGPISLISLEGGISLPNSPARLASKQKRKGKLQAFLIHLWQIVRLCRTWRQIIF